MFGKRVVCNIIIWLVVWANYHIRVEFGAAIFNTIKFYFEMLCDGMEEEAFHFNDSRD